MRVRLSCGVRDFVAQRFAISAPPMLLTKTIGKFNSDTANQVAGRLTENAMILYLLGQMRSMTS